MYFNSCSSLFHNLTFKRSCWKILGFAHFPKSKYFFKLILSRKVLFHFQIIRYFNAVFKIVIYPNEWVFLPLLYIITLKHIYLIYLAIFNVRFQFHFANFIAWTPAFYFTQFGLKSFTYIFCINSVLIFVHLNIRDVFLCLAHSKIFQYISEPLCIFQKKK